MIIQLQLKVFFPYYYCFIIISILRLFSLLFTKTVEKGKELLWVTVKS